MYKSSPNYMVNKGIERSLCENLHKKKLSTNSRPANNLQSVKIGTNQVISSLPSLSTVQQVPACCLFSLVVRPCHVFIRVGRPPLSSPTPNRTNQRPGCQDHSERRPTCRRKKVRFSKQRRQATTPSFYECIGTLKRRQRCTCRDGRTVKNFSR